MIIFAGLFLILTLVLTLPFLAKKVEEELEVFLFIMGCLAVTLTSQWHAHLLTEALTEPIKITLAVFIAGLVFKALQTRIAHKTNKLASALGMKLSAFLLIVLLGLLSSIITAIIAALLLVEIISHLSLDRKHEVSLVILACFSIGFGAALTPIGEPLSTIVIGKLQGIPYQADFFFLLKHLWIFLVPGIAAVGILGAVLTPQTHTRKPGLKEDKQENIKSIALRTLRVYFFIVALVLLGAGFKPMIDTYVSKLPFQGLYWLNMVSAVLDNATLAAAEIGPSMGLVQIKSALLGLLIAGGMLIPGNIPNIIVAGKLKIKSSEWAKFGIPLGFVLMIIYFAWLLLAGKA